MLDLLAGKISSTLSFLSQRAVVTDHDVQQSMCQVRDNLLDADVPYEVVDSFMDLVTTELNKQRADKRIAGSQRVVTAVHNALLSFLGGMSSTTESITFALPSVIMMMGLQGSGKTTTAAKIACYIKKQAAKRGKTRRILMASVDFYRPAAIEQLEVMAAKVGVGFYRATTVDTLEAAQEIYRYFQQERYELLLLDTAGRMHVDGAMLQELIAIDKVLKPRYKFLVLDAMTGQQSLVVARAFEQAVQFDGACLTKMDSDTRGGAALSFRYALKKPIFFVGVGEKIDDIDMWRPDRMAKRLLGMGDMETLFERAQDVMGGHEQDSLKRIVETDAFTLDDFAQQMGMMQKLGSLSSVMRYMPGMGNKAISADELEKAERELGVFKVIMNSMTLKERQMKVSMDRSRICRIAAGSGVLPEDVTRLLNRFQETVQCVKLLKKSGPFKQFFK